MSAFSGTGPGRFGRIVILLSAAIPSVRQLEDRQDNLHLVTEEAIISLGRAAFAQGVRLVFTGKPDVAFLLADLAGEYTVPRYAEGPHVRPREEGESVEQLLTAYVSRPEAREQGLLEAMELLERSGFFAVRWTEEGPVNPFQIVQETRPDFLICVGGQADTRRTAGAFREFRSRQRIYVMETTGGVSQSLAQEAPDTVNAFDRIFMRELAGRMETPMEGERLDLLTQGIPPYPLIMQRLVADLTGHIG